MNGIVVAILIVIACAGIFQLGTWVGRLIGWISDRWTR